MATLPPLAEADVERWVGEQALTRGRTYFREGAVGSPQRAGLTLIAQCRGSRPAPYFVEIALGEQGIVSGSCSCPVGDGGRCKHAAALLLAWVHTPGAFVAVGTLDARLERLDKAELVALVQRLVRRSPELQTQLELELPAQGGAGAPLPVDIQALQRQVGRALGGRGGYGYDWGTSYAMSVELQPSLEVGDAYLERGDYRNAAVVYQTVAQSILERYDQIHDEESELAGVVNQCVDGLAECLRASDTPATREAIVKALFDIYHWDIQFGGVGIGDGVPTILVEQGSPEERQLVAGWVRASLPAGDDSFASYRRQAYGRFLLELEYDTLDDESFLRTCRETGQLNRLVERLLERGRVDEAATAAREASDHQLRGLADLFNGHDQAALFENLVRERLATSHDLYLLGWLKQRTRDTGNLEEALTLAEQLFWRAPAVAGYQEVKELAQGQGRWDILRESLRSKLAERENYALLTEIYLVDAEIDRALETLARVKPSAWLGYGADTLHLRVARAAEESRPEAAIRLYRMEVERLIGQQGRDNYAAAARHLTRVRDLYRRLGEPQTWRTLISAVQDQHRRLRALRDELQKAGLFDPEPDPEPEPEPEAPQREEQRPSILVHLLRSPDSPHGR
jgi:hypothetical protein